MPLFSIIIPLYNKEETILNTLNSVLGQSFKDFEIILVDDGSTDQSLTIAKQPTDHRIQVYSKTNEGVGPTRNYAVEKALGSHIAFLDADDLWESNHLENLAKLIQKYPNAGLYCTAYTKKYSSSLLEPMVSPVAKKPKGWQGLVPDFFAASYIDCVAWTSAVAMPVTIFKKLNGFDIKITHGAGEDTDLWIRAAVDYPVAFSNTITATYNLLGANRISHTPTLDRTFIHLDSYNAFAKENPTLHKFLDLNRYSLAIQHQLAGDTKSALNYKNKIAPKHLNGKQRLLLKMPRLLLRLVKRSQIFLTNNGIYLSAYR